MRQCSLQQYLGQHSPLVGIGVTAQVTQAIQLSDGTVYFVQPPDLVEATFNSVQNGAQHTISRSTYPRRQRTPPAGNYYPARRDHTSNSKDSRAFVGTRNRKGAHLTLGKVTQERKTRTVYVTFDPVTPGKMVTIGLRPVQNPRFSGVYLFGVRVSSGEKSHGQFVGFGRLRFYGGGLRRFGAF